MYANFALLETTRHLVSLNHSDLVVACHKSTFPADLLIASNY